MQKFLWGIILLWMREGDETMRLPINVDPEIMGGTPVFEGTRVPIDALTNNLAEGVSLEEFLDNFPTVTREQALAIIDSIGKENQPT
jgi:uncharacterized protein (DUF433 family)